MGRVNKTLPALCAIALSACGDEPVSYYPDVQAVLNDQCVECHNSDGAWAFPLDSYALASALSAEILSAVEDGSMPPWPADPDCREFDGERSMSDADRRTIRQWVDAGAPEGDPDDALPPAEFPSGAQLQEITHEYTLPIYTPEEIDGADDWRCFIHEEVRFEEEVYLTASEVLPGTSQVHHVIFAVIDDEDLANAQRLDAEDERPGYLCWGPVVPWEQFVIGGAGAFGEPPERVGRWVPGQGPDVLPEGTAVRVPAGSTLVSQVHYSLLGEEAREDETTLRLRLTDEPPERVRIGTAIIADDVWIAAGDPDAVISEVWPYYSDEPLHLRALAGHMHLFGSQISAVQSTPEGGEACLLDIPRWDYENQLTYTLPGDETIEIASGSAIDLTCRFDNSAENQPEVDGAQQEPQDVTWGESSTDEMCFMMIERFEDWAPSPAAGDAACAETEACLASCEGDGAGDRLSCALSCEAMETDCFSCFYNATEDLAPECLAELEADDECARLCFASGMVMDGNMGACLEAECGESYSGFLSCAQSASPSFDLALEGCGL